MPTQPTQKQSRLYWLKWIDRQYAKADPLHVKMRTELSTKEGEEDAETIDDPSHAGDSRLIDYGKDEGDSIMGIAFVKLLRSERPKQQAISGKAQEVAAWIRDNVLTDEEKRAVEGLLSG